MLPFVEPQNVASISTVATAGNQVKNQIQCNRNFCRTLNNTDFKLLEPVKCQSKVKWLKALHLIQLRIMKKEVRIALLNGNVSFIDERSCDDYSSKSSCLIMLQRWIIHLRTRVGSSCTYLGRLASVRRCVLLLIFLCLVFLLYSAHHLSSIRFNKWVKIWTYFSSSSLTSWFADYSFV